MQLDSLDSSETWILNLTLRRTIPIDLSSHQPISTLRHRSSMQWERTVAEGQDRMYRDWFHSSEPEPNLYMQHCSAILDHGDGS